MARWNRPRFSGEQIYANTLPAPADCPKMVMFSGSPPNAAMFLTTHRMPARWSRKPKFA